MRQTVVGIFDNATEALQAVQKLVAQGILRENIDISNNANTSHSASSNEHESGITKFFKNLFGDGHDDVSKYASVAARSQSIITVHALSDKEAERAADILDDNGAVNVDERADSNNNTSGSTGNTTPTFGDTSNAIGAFDTGTAAGPSGTASLPDDFSHLENTDSDVTASETGLSDESYKTSATDEGFTTGSSREQIASARLRSRIVQRPVEDSFRLREERRTDF
jgi:hypothetical protein